MTDTTVKLGPYVSIVGADTDHATCEDPCWCLLVNYTFKTATCGNASGTLCTKLTSNDATRPPTHLSSAALACARDKISADLPASWYDLSITGWHFYWQDVDASPLSEHGL